MDTLKSKIMMVCVFALVLNLLFACAHNPPPGPSSEKQEVWEVYLDGQGEGRLKMIFTRRSKGDNIFTIKGKLSGSMKDHLAGEGYVDLGLSGSIRGQSFTVDISGQSEMAEGPSFVSGKLIGTLSESSGSGKWNVIHKAGASAGKYTMERMN